MKNQEQQISNQYDQQLPDECPPQAATQRDQVAFRIVKNNPPTADDFRTYTQLGLLPDADPCKRASLSVFESYRQAKHLRDLRPYLGEFIASANLTTLHGMLSPASGTGHVSWWAFAGSVNPAEFSVADHEY